MIESFISKVKPFAAPYDADWHERMRCSEEISSVRFAISYPEPPNFLRRMLDENEGLWKGPVLKVRK